MIKPTLFVGLGTTGTNIIKSLRQLMFEEYGHAGLPIFRYIAIETDGNEKGIDPELRLTNQMQNYERIEVISATIQNTAPIYNKINPNHTRYNRHLADWLYPELLKVETHSFGAGAKNIRMAGRLCLWENWGEMQQKVERARAAIIAQDTTEKAQDLLKRYYQSKGRQLPQEGLIDDGAINVYIVGSLCGGSCSGMLIDVAYYFRSILPGQDSSNVYGMFTMFDREQATGNDIDTGVRAANCYASLLELNYYNHTDTKYDITFPTGHRVENMRRKPFDFASFVSRSSRTSTIQHVLPSGGFDEDGLNLMVALNLFAETAGDTDGQKAAIRTDWDGYEGVWGLKDPAIQGEISYMVKFMASFGLTAVWYPKYRIATAAASLVSQDLTNILLGKYVPQATILADAAKEWNSIYESNMDILTEPKGQRPLKSRIESELNRVISNPQASRQTAFSDKFNQSGDYYKLIEIQKPHCEEAYRNAVEQFLSNQLAVIDFQSKTGLADVIAFFKALDEEIEKSIESLPERLPPFNLKLNLTPTKSIINSWWTKSLGLQKRATEEGQGNVINEYRKAITGDRESAYQKMRNFFLRQVLENVRAELGFGVQPNDADEVNPAGTIKRRLENIQSNLNTSVNTFKNDYDRAIRLRNYASVKIVTDDPQNKIEKDAEVLRDRIMKMDTLSPLQRKVSMDKLLTQGHRDITTQMTETYSRMSLEEIPVKDVVTKAKNILETGGEENDITSMAARSNPYQAFNDNFVQLQVDVPPKIICGDGSNKDSLSDLKESLDRTGRNFPRLGGSSVDHLLFFYEEEASFAIDDLDGYVRLEEHFQNKPGTYGHLTHHNPDFYDLALYHKTQRLQQWCRALGRIVPEICQINKDAFSGVFYQTKNGYIYEYNIDGLSERLSLHNNADEIKKLSQKQNETEYNKFINSVRSSFIQLNREPVRQLINSLLREIEDNQEHASISQFFRQFLDDVYSVDASIDNTDSNSVSGSTFFQTPLQTRQQTPTLQPDDISTPPSQEVDNDNASQPTAGLDDYGGTASEESEIDAGSFNQPDTEHNEVGVTSPQNTASPQDASDATDSEYVSTEVEPETELGPLEDTTGEESPAEQQPQPETDEQEKQEQPPTRPWVKNPNVKQMLQRKGTRKKE